MKENQQEETSSLLSEVNKDTLGINTRISEKDTIRFDQSLTTPIFIVFCLVLALSQAG